MIKFLGELIEGFRTDAQTKNVPRASGIYQIRCMATGKVYVGSAVDIQARWRNHYDSLKRGKHRNKYLQAAWDKYGARNFECTVLELVDRDNLLEREQEWLDRTECTNREVGFNLYHSAGSPGDAFAQKWEGFIDPDGDEVTIENLAEFCRQNGLDAGLMRQIAHGKTKHKGWRHKNNIRQRDM